MNKKYFQKNEQQRIEPTEDSLFLFLSNIFEKSPIKEFNDTTPDDLFWYGFIALLVGAFCFGTVHVPIRRYNGNGNGLFIQWIMSIGILCVGFCMQIIQNSLQIEYLALLGGFLWSIANSLAQHVISGLGLGVALFLWNTTNCLTGWSSGRWGLFGLKKVIPYNQLLNILGLIILLIGGFSFIFVKKTITKNNLKKYSYQTKKYRSKKKSPLLLFLDLKTIQKGKDSVKQRIVQNHKRIICIFLALISGFFYGMTVIPVIYMENHPEIFPNSSRTGLPYIFSHYFGIFIGSTTIFVIYVIIKRNKPSVNASAILPSLVGGIIWAIGMILLFISNDILKQTITYPVMTTLPGCIATLWSVFYFKEINNSRNYFIIACAFLLIVIGAILVLLSRIKI